MLCWNVNARIVESISRLCEEISRAIFGAVLVHEDGCWLENFEKFVFWCFEGRLEDVDVPGRPSLLPADASVDDLISVSVFSRTKSFGRRSDRHDVDKSPLIKCDGIEQTQSSQDDVSVGQDDELADERVGETKQIRVGRLRSPHHSADFVRS